jgi:nucleoside-diphosphate-sugar epimerase
MRVLVTGITGYIGRNLALLLSTKHSVFGFYLPGEDISQLEAFENITLFQLSGGIESISDFITKSNPDGIIHLAALVLREHNPEQIPTLIQANLLFPSLILDLSVRSGVSWFINTGTYWQNYKDQVYNPVNLYAATKQAFEDIAKYYIETTDIRFITIRLCDNYGPFDTRPKLINTWKRISRTGEVLKMSPGEQIVDFLYIDDITKVYQHLAELLHNNVSSLKAGDVFYLKSPNTLTLKNYARVFEQVTGRRLNILWGGIPYRSREIMQPVYVGRAVPDWKPEIKFAQGIKMLFEKEVLEYGQSANT